MADQMNRIHKFIVFRVIGVPLLVLFLSLLVSPDSHAFFFSKKIRVMTYNIRVGTGGGKERLEAKQGLKKVAKVIKRYKPDVILLQEVDRGAGRTQYIDELHWLKENLGYEQSAYAPAIVDGTAQYGVAILTRFHGMIQSQRYELQKPDYTKTHPDYPAYYSEQRVLLRASMNVRGVTINFFCTHLGLTPDQREVQMKEIAQVLKATSGPVVVGGDFNADRVELTPFRSLLKNPFDLVGIPVKERASFPSSKPWQSIDHVLISSELEAISAKVVDDKTLASDHNPVYADLKIATSPKK